MSFSLYLLLLLVAATVFAIPAANPTVLIDPDSAYNSSVPAPESGGPWAKFCENADGTGSCGQWVSIDNTGCLNENYRKSIVFKGYNHGFTLVTSPSPDCVCESQCDELDCGDEICDVWDISSYGYGKQSFRFVAQGCEADNCDATAAASVASTASTTAAPAMISAEPAEPAEPTYAVDIPSPLDETTYDPKIHDHNSTLSKRTAPWARFCNDVAGTKGCGQWVNLRNSGCLNQNGRKSIAFQGSNHGFRLIVSPSPDCPCQANCYATDNDEDTAGHPPPVVWDITQYGSGRQSFRFIHQDYCDSDNCN